MATSKTCRYPGCSKPCPPPTIGYHVQAPGYCCHGHSEGAQRAREKARRVPSVTTIAARPCAWRECGKSFRPRANAATARFCSKRCSVRNAARRVDVSPTRRAGASEEAAQRASAGRCPDCRGGLGADGPLLFCVARCGFDLLLTARRRMAWEAT